MCLTRVQEVLHLITKVNDGTNRCFSPNVSSMSIPNIHWITIYGWFFFFPTRWTPMEFSLSGPPSPSFLLRDFHCVVLHWLPLSGMMWTLEGLVTFSTGRQPMLPCYKELAIDFKNHFRPLATSLQPFFLLPHGTELLNLVGDLR